MAYPSPSGFYLIIIGAKDILLLRGKALSTGACIIQRAAGVVWGFCLAYSFLIRGISPGLVVWHHILNGVLIYMNLV